MNMIKEKIFFLVVFAVCALGMAGCSQREAPTHMPDRPESFEFEAGEHAYEAGYGVEFDTEYTKAGVFTLHIKESEFREEAAQELAGLVFDDCAALLNTVETQAQEVEIYVVGLTKTGGVMISGNRIFCQTSHIKNGDYRQALVQVLYGMTEPWQCYGLSSFVLGENAVNTQELAAYYEEEDNLPQLSLFAAWFCSAFADEETVRMTQDTATSFTEFLLAKEGLDGLQNCGQSEELRQEWLDWIGAAATYEAFCDLSYLDGATYSEDSAYPLIIHEGQHSFNLRPLENMETPGQVMQVFSSYFEGMENILAFVKENAPEHYDIVEGNWLRELDFNFGETDWSIASSDYCVIHLPYALIHETMHLLFPLPVRQTEVWRSEAIAVYMSCAADVIIEGDIWYYYYCNEDYDQYETEDMALIFQWLQEYYHAHEIKEEYDQKLYFRAWGLFPEHNPGYDITYMYPLYRSVSDQRDIILNQNYENSNGNDLTCYQAFVMADYLIEQNGLDTFLEMYFSNADFEETYGMDYRDAFAKADAEYYP